MYIVIIAHTYALTLRITMMTPGEEQRTPCKINRGLRLSRVLHKEAHPILVNKSRGLQFFQNIRESTFLSFDISCRGDIMHSPSSLCTPWHL